MHSKALTPARSVRQSEDYGRLHSPPSVFFLLALAWPLTELLQRQQSAADILHACATAHGFTCCAFMTLLACLLYIVSAFAASQPSNGTASLDCSYPANERTCDPVNECTRKTACAAFAGGLDRRLPNVHRIVAAFANAFASRGAAADLSHLRGAFDAVVPVGVCSRAPRRSSREDRQSAGGHTRCSQELCTLTSVCRCEECIEAPDMPDAPINDA